MARAEGPAMKLPRKGWGTPRVLVEAIRRRDRARLERLERWRAELLHHVRRLEVHLLVLDRVSVALKSLAASLARTAP